MTVLTPTPARTDTRVASVPTSRTWALTGVVAGVTGAIGIVASGFVGAVYDESLAGDPDAIARAVLDDVPAMLVFHTATLVSAVAMVVFGVGLFRRLAARTGPGSLAPAVAAAGLLGTAVVGVLGTGLDTEFIFAGAGHEDMVDPHAVIMFNHWIGTVPWCWVLAGLSGTAVWVASRAGAAPRWIGRVGLVLGGLTLLLGITPLQYMAGMTGPLWLLVTAIGFTLGDRAFRAGR